MHKTSRIGWRRTALFALLTLCLSVSLVELFARFGLPSPWEISKKPSEDPLLVPNPVRGYGLRPNLTRRWESADFDVEVRLNERGLRDEPLETARSAPLRVLAAGDSYTFGIGVEHEQSWTEELERRLTNGPQQPATAAVLNSGVPGYSARQIRQSVEEFLPALSGQIVVFGMYANSYWRVENPYVIHGGTLTSTDRVGATEIGPSGELILTAFAPGRPRSLDIWLKRYFHAGAHLLSLVNDRRHWPERPPQENTPESLARDYQPALAEIAETHRFASEHGAKLVVMPINPQQADGSFADLESTYNAILRDFCAREKIGFLDPLPEFVRRAQGRPIFRFPTDQHWSSAAHEIAAQLIHHLFVEEGLTGLGQAPES